MHSIAGFPFYHFLIFFQWNIQIALAEFYSHYHQILLRYSRLALQKHGKAIYWTNRFMSDHIINSLSNMVELWLVLTFYYICVKAYTDMKYLFTQKRRDHIFTDFFIMSTRLSSLHIIKCISFLFMTFEFFLGCHLAILLA